MGEPSKGTYEPYSGPSGVMGDSLWFTYADIVGAEMLVVIEEVRARRGVKFVQGSAKPVEYFLKFVGIEKELRVGATIRRVIDQLHTPGTENWPGKALVLFVEHGIKVGKEERLGVRVRNRKVDPPAEAWSKKAALERLLHPENREHTKAAAVALGLAIAKSGDLLALTDDQVRSLEKKVTELQTAESREPGGEG